MHLCGFAAGDLGTAAGAFVGKKVVQSPTALTSSASALQKIKTRFSDLLAKFAPAEKALLRGLLNRQEKKGD